MSRSDGEFETLLYSRQEELLLLESKETAEACLSDGFSTVNGATSPVSSIPTSPFALVTPSLAAFTYKKNESWPSVIEGKN